MNTSQQDVVASSIGQIAPELKLASEVVHELTAPYQASQNPLPDSLRVPFRRMVGDLLGLKRSIDSILGSLSRAGLDAKPIDERVTMEPAEPDDPATALPLAVLGPGPGFQKELRACHHCYSHFAAESQFECLCPDCAPR